MIQLDDAPVVREPILANPNLGAMKDETENALPKCSKVLGDVAIELVRLLDFILRSVDQANEFLALCRDSLVLILLQSRDPGRLPRGNGCHLVIDELQNSTDCFIECFNTEMNDIFTRVVVCLARVGLILKERRWAGDVRTGQKPDTLVGLVAAEAEE